MDPLSWFKPLQFMQESRSIHILQYKRHLLMAALSAHAGHHIRTRSRSVLFFPPLGLSDMRLWNDHALRGPFSFHHELVAPRAMWIDGSPSSIIWCLSVFGRRECSAKPAEVTASCILGILRRLFTESTCLGSVIHILTQQFYDLSISIL